MVDHTRYERPYGIRGSLVAGGVIVRLADGWLLAAFVRCDGLDGYLLPKGGVDAGETIEQASGVTRNIPRRQRL